jgi:hypothetical protein
MARDSSPIGPLDVIALATLAVPGLGEVGVVGEIASEARVARGASKGYSMALGLWKDANTGEKLLQPFANKVGA